MDPQELFLSLQRKMTPTVDQSKLADFAKTPAGAVARQQMYIATGLRLGSYGLGALALYGLFTKRPGMVAGGLIGGAASFYFSMKAMRAVTNAAAAAGAIRQG